MFTKHLYIGGDVKPLYGGGFIKTPEALQRPWELHEAPVYKSISEAYVQRGFINPWELI